MGLFDGVRGRVTAKAFTFDTQQCIVLLLLSSVYADDWESQKELLVLRQIMSKSPLFADSDNTNDQLIVEQCKQYLKTNVNGLDQACSKLPPSLRKTAFAMAVEIVFADGLVHQQEETFIAALIDSLEIETGFARGVIHTFEALYSDGAA